MLKVKYLLILSTLIILTSCFKPTIRGYVFSSNMELENKITKSMEMEEVIAILGIPTFQINDKLYYVSTKSKQHPFKSERILEKNALIISFDKNNSVSDIEFVNAKLGGGNKK